MRLKDLLLGIPVLDATADLDLSIEKVVYDSRKVTKGSLFVAVAGFHSDGNRYIPMALEKGAAAVVTAHRPAGDIPYVLVENDSLALAMIGCSFYRHPAKSLTLIGVTGTNGKTSVTMLLKQMLEKTMDAKVGLIGTMKNMIGRQELPAERTTPDSFTLQALLSQMRDDGCRYAVMEVSSHAIAQERIGGLRFDVAVFTNLTEDHLDFHRTMENYCAVKAKLFQRCGKAVLNRDDAWYARIRGGAECPVLTVSAKAEADLWAKDIRLQADGVSFTAVRDGKETGVTVPIPGRFTVYNALVVLGIAVQLGIPVEAAAKALASAEGVRGRVEVVPTPGKPYTVLLDYAHTPDGLENVLTSVRDFCKGRIITVFGCGGDRDPIKRPIMGRIGVTLSDIAVITSDNPRSEEPMAIISDILSGVPETYKNYVVIENRRNAIRYAMDIGKKSDIIILAGKGHETYQEIRGIKYTLDEREEVAAYLTETED